MTVNEKAQLSDSRAFDLITNDGLTSRTDYPNYTTTEPCLQDNTSNEVETRAAKRKRRKKGIQVELLDDAPITMRRPLALIDGHGHAATWAHVRVTVTETVDKDGKVIQHRPPLVRDEQRLITVRENGEAFNDGRRDLTRLGFNVNLPEIPPSDKLWSVRGIKAFKKGLRPSPANVFQRICDIVGRFIDFDKSVAEQREMCEFIASYILATWFLDAFNVAGNLWPNGQRGSGKTQLLTLVASLGYLGQVILAGGSFPTLRDLADYGAMLCFDDAENLADPRKTDPDKRALLLAGNRRGNTVTLKEPSGDRTWRTRHVSTFCPRAFSAINLPDPVLASRTIIVPLVRTSNREKANADPLDFALWPHNRRELIDDLWALALANISKLSEYDARIGREATLMGRSLEPWRSVLAVALWLDENGVTGLWKRMDELSRDYQSERQEFESGDLTALVVRALVRCLGCEGCEQCEGCEGCSGTLQRFITTSQITKTAADISNELEANIDLYNITSLRVGRVLSSLRLRKGREGGTGRSGWMVSQAEASQCTRSLGVKPLSKISSV